MSAVKGAMILAAGAVALYAGVRVLDNALLKRHNKLTMEREKVVTQVLEQEFAQMTPAARIEFMKLKAVNTYIGEYLEGSRTVESLKHMLGFYRRNFA